MPVFSDGDTPDPTLDDGAWGLDQDPPPDAVPKPRKGPVFKPTTSGAITPAMRKRIAGELEAYGLMVAMPIMLRDDVCGQVIVDQTKPICDAIAAIMSRYPEIAHKFLATGVLGDWMKLFAAAYPVFKVVYEHHVKPRPDEQEGAEGADQPVYAPYRPGT